MYDKDGEPIDDPVEWGRLFGDLQYRFVGATTIRADNGGLYRVSTVWLGMDHSWGSGPPLIFETMVFIDEAGSTEVSWMDRYCDRYPTEAEAKAGHQLIVGMVSGALTVTELAEHDMFVI